MCPRIVPAVLILTFGVVLVGACNDGWTQHGEFCFKYMHETYNWLDARAVCDVMGGYLAEDSTDDIHSFLTGWMHTLGSHAVWIGANDFAEEGIWMWTNSKQRVEHTRWRAGEPQDAHGEEDCAGMIVDAWFDINCEDARYPFICQTTRNHGAVIG